MQESALKASGTESEFGLNNPIQAAALSLGFENDIDFLHYAGRRSGVNEQTRKAYIDSYLMSKAGVEIYTPYFARPFIELAERKPPRSCRAPVLIAENSAPSSREDSEKKLAKKLAVRKSRRKSHLKLRVGGKRR